MKNTLKIAFASLFLSATAAFGQVAISGLPAATTPLAGTEVVPIVQGGVTKKVAVSNIGSGGGGCTTANPTATIGATAVNGSASTCMRSDAAPALPATLPALNASNLTALTPANLSAQVPVNKGGTNCTSPSITCLGNITSATGTPSGTTFFRGDNSWATPAGAGNVTGPGSAVSGNIATYNGTSGTLIQDGGATIASLAPAGLGAVITTNNSPSTTDWKACKTLTVNNSGLTITVPAASTLQANGGCLFVTTLANTVTLAPNAADAINGGTTGASLVLPAKSTIMITTDGVNGIFSGSNATTGTGSNVLASSPAITTPTISSPTLSGTVAGAGTIPNTVLVNSSTTIGGQSVALGAATTNQGNGGKLQLSTGTTTTNNCAKFDANGNTIDAGAPCGGAAGTVTTTGSPASSNLTKFSGAATVTNADLSGDLTTSGTTATTLATVNATTGTFGDATHCASVTVNGKGLITAASQSTSCPGTGSTVSVTAATPNVVITPSPGTGTFTIGTTAVDSVNSGTSTSYTFLSSDSGTTVRRTAGSAMTDTLPTVGTTGFGAGFSMTVCTGPVAGQSKDTITTSSKIANGGSLVGSIIIPAGSCVVISDPAGTNYVALGLTQAVVGQSPISGGTSGALPYNNAGVMGEVTQVNSSVVSRTSGGAIQESTTLPSGITIPSATLSSPSMSSPTMTSAALGTITSGDLTNATNYPVASLTGAGTGVLSALAANASGTSGGFCRSVGSACAGAAGSGVAIYSSGVSTTLTAGTYFAPFGGAGIPVATEANAPPARSPAASTIANLQVLLSVDPGNTNTVTVTARDNASDQTSTCVVTGNGTTNLSCSDTTHSFNPAQGDKLSFKVVNSASYTGTISISATWGTTNVGVTQVAGGTGIDTGGSCTTSCTVALATMAADTIKMNATGSTAAPTNVAMPNCPLFGNAYNTTSHTWGCTPPGIFSLYIANNFYPLVTSGSIGGGATAVGSATVIRWTPFYVAQPMTISQICQRVITTNAGNFQMALYANGAANTPTGSALFSTASQTAASAAMVCPSQTYAFTAPGVYWFGHSDDNAVATFQGSSSTSGGTMAAYLVGASTVADLFQTTGNAVGLQWSTTGATYGTWPTNPTITESTSSNTNLMTPIVKISSVP